MVYKDIVDNYKDKMLILNVRKIKGSRIMIEGDKESLLYLSEYIKHHANNDKTCYAEVPLAINLIGHTSDQLDLFLHSLPCKENC